MSLNRSLIAPTFHAPLEQALKQKLERRQALAGSLGELEPLAVRLGLIRNTLKPRLHDPQLLIFAADHGLAVDGITTPSGASTLSLVNDLAAGRLPVAAFARIHGMGFTVVDSGLAVATPRHPGVLPRKIAHATRNTRVGPAMSVDQAQAAIRAGMEIADGLPGNVLACAGLGEGSEESAALVISRLGQLPVRDLVMSSPQMNPDLLARLMVVLEGAQGRHRNVTDPVEILAALGGFEIAMMAGAMLVAAGKRHLIIVDGLPACAALMVASRIAAPATDYCVYARSHNRQGLSFALQHLRVGPLLELGLESVDGAGAALAWPLVHSAAALLSEVAEGEELEASQPAAL
ncbi:nicotinate-nucleotide--dimethylbenzimidazole phosphoribosyltransferase [Aquabacterium sp. A7-Y]|uniref:nicotinate-nucleotide--dimethylbenzimidazole phosphoribosyltransferase n=1 Tax=Aquabacterium sp. A7-Y TaxID=1349605 RepID=UPI00223D4BFB|nr:nicotinate-nucleotide--dimethylbenzimidazole phosphoribosyltransferase [Aquabacterium sp. A7-Y]MCW7539879.1 nicotinate-nucleotide--dimethylbenzimidazole phosphoribosyltransferase [Aquabacterium sp. A7-Y]